MKRYYMFLSCLCAFALAAVGYNYAITAGAKADKQTSTDVSTLASDIEGTTVGKRALPTSLEQAVAAHTSSLKPPLSKFSYRLTSARSYALCADFQTDTKDWSDADLTVSASTVIDPTKHPKGQVCWQVTLSDYDFDTAGSSPAPLPAPAASPIPAACNATVAGGSAALTGQITSLDLTRKSFQMNAGANADGPIEYMYWNIEPTVYSKSCAASSVKTLKTGDTVTVYFDVSHYALLILQQ